jgi:hypothetical protein
LFEDREQGFSTLHPEAARAASKTLDLLRNAEVVTDEFILAKLGC